VWPSFVYCNFWADGNTVIVISGCGTCNGDEYLELLDINDNELASNDDGCTSGSLCSSIKYTSTATNSSELNMYKLAQGCASQSCSGIITITGANVKCNKS
jgi:hypothetical protein